MAQSVAPPVLETGRLVIRMANYLDIAAIADYYRRNRAFLQPFEPTRTDSFFTELFWQHQVDYNQQDFYADQTLKLFLFSHPVDLPQVPPEYRDPTLFNPTPFNAPTEEPDECVVGIVNFSQFVRQPLHSCLLGYSLDERHQGQGLMQEALTALLPWVFEQMRFHRVEANYLPRNQRSANLLRRLGFQVEGYSRDYLQINNQWEDHIRTALINPNWPR
jgi:[ribosomal protein S5]-alanine N-acetyltransferase